MFCLNSIFHTKVRLFWLRPLFIFVFIFNSIIFSLAECSLHSCSVEFEVYWRSLVFLSVFTSISFVYSTFYAQGRVSYGHSNITKFPCDQTWPPIKDINIHWSQFCMETASKNIRKYVYVCRLRDTHPTASRFAEYFFANTFQASKMGFNWEKTILGLYVLSKRSLQIFCNAEKQIHFVFRGPNTVLKVLKTPPYILESQQQL